MDGIPKLIWKEIDGIPDIEDLWNKGLNIFQKFQGPTNFLSMYNDLVPRMGVTTIDLDILFIFPL